MARTCARHFKWTVTRQSASVTFDNTLHKYCGLPSATITASSPVFHGGTVKRKLRLAVSALSWCLVFAGCGGKNDAINQAEKQDVINGTSVPSIEQTKQIAQEGFIYGLPLVMNYAVMYQFNVDKTSSQFKAPFNAISNEARVFTYRDTAVITPNSDTPYSLLTMDLRTEPFVLSVPAVPRSRYYAVQLTDGDTFNFGSIGTRATGTEAGDYLVVGPDWTGATPPKIKKVFHSSTQFAMAIFRTQLLSPTDMPNVVNVQKGYKGQPLSSYLKQPAPAAAPAIDFMAATDESVKQNFFDYLDFAMQFAPAGPEEAGIRAKLASIGIGPGKKFAMKDLSAEHKVAVLLGMKAGSDAVDKFIASGSKDINGWQVGSWFGDRAFYNGDWLRRAGAARAGIYGNTAIEACYPATRVLPNGDAVDTSKHNYATTFAAGKCILVGDDVRRQEPTTDRESDQSLFDQFADASELEEKPRRFTDVLHPERRTVGGQKIQLVARTERHRVPGDAAVLAERDAALDSAHGRRHVAAASRCAGAVRRCVLTSQLLINPKPDKWT